MSKKFFGWLLLGFITALLGASDSKADVIYSNLTSTLNAGEVVAGSAINSGLQGEPLPGANGQQLFQAQASFLLSRVVVGVSFFEFPESNLPAQSPQFNVWLYSDYFFSTGPVGGFGYFHQPLNPLAEISQNIVAPDNPTLVTVPAIPGTITLDPGSFYWIILEPANADTSVLWSSSDNGYHQSLEVDGTAITPEPSTIGLLTFPLLALTFLRQRNPQKA